MSQASRSKEVDRFIGISLGGAKSDRTSVTVIDLYRKQEKAFVVDSFASVGPEKGHGHRKEYTGDKVLLELIEEYKGGLEVIGTDAPLTLPPCFTGCNSDCSGYEKCKRSEVKWMRNQYKKVLTKSKKVKHFTPYTQRPVDLYFRYKNLGVDLFEDETLGANKAPQTARMQYLKQFLQKYELVEVWPRLSLLASQKAFDISAKDVRFYKHVEKGAGVREKILEGLVDWAELFIYERDFGKFLQNASAFDSLICAWTAMQYSLGRVLKPRADLPVDSGWVQIPHHG